LFEVLVNLSKRDTIFKNTPALKGLREKKLNVQFSDVL